MSVAVLRINSFWGFKTIWYFSRRGRDQIFVIFPRKILTCTEKHTHALTNYHLLLTPSCLAPNPSVPIVKGASLICHPPLLKLPTTAKTRFESFNTLCNTWTYIHHSLPPSTVTRYTKQVVFIKKWFFSTLLYIVLHEACRLAFLFIYFFIFYFFCFFFFVQRIFWIFLFLT